MRNLMQASNQWASRPDDERFLSLDELREAVLDRRNLSREIVLPSDHLTVEADGSEIVVVPRPDLAATHSKHEAIRGSRLTNWTFNQLCARAEPSVPGSFVSRLPTELAVVNLAWCLESADRKDAKFLMTENGQTQLRSITSSTYGRIWDHEVVEAVQKRIDPDVWKIPSASYASRDPKAATTLYASDRDIFLFMVDETHPIEVNGDRLHRGFFVWNSETGKCVFGIKTFLYRYVCDNRIVWGASNEVEVKVRHTKGGPARFVAEAAPALAQYVESSTQTEVRAIQYANAHTIGDDRNEVVSWLQKRGFTKSLALLGARKAEEEADLRGGDPRSLYHVVNGLTDAAKDSKHTDARLKLEERAGKLLDLAAAQV